VLAIGANDFGRALGDVAIWCVDLGEHGQELLCCTLAHQRHKGSDDAADKPAVTITSATIPGTRIGMRP
jgi:hypothetical protein